MYNEYMKYATRMAQIYNEYVKRVQIMSELYKELAENSERINELQRESIQITEEMSKNWFAKYYFFGNRIEGPLSSAAREEE